MLTAQPHTPSEQPHDILHAVALATGAPVAYLSWPSRRYIWTTASYAHLLEQSHHDLHGKALQKYLPSCGWSNWKCSLELLTSAQTHGASLETPLIFTQNQLIQTQLISLAADGAVYAVVILPMHGRAPSNTLPVAQGEDDSMRRFVNASSESVIFFRHGRIFYANPAAIALTGYQLDQLLDRSVLHLLPHVLRASAQNMLEHGTISAQETRLLRHNGQEQDVEITITLQPEEGGDLGVMVLRDITERKRAEAEMHFLAFHDPLTRQLNRQGLMRQLQQTLERATQFNHRCAVLYVDLDRFKDVNDSMGHDAGDKLLVEAARRLRSKVHPDDIVARLGADEFVVVLASPLTACQPECILREIQFLMNKPYALSKGLANLPASIGISLYPEDGNSAEELMLNASAAMEMAKNLGQGNHQYYSALMHMRPSKWLTQDRLLREAIEKDQGLVLHYQPLWDLSRDCLEGFEALVRWQHPERGLLPPSEFISFAESRGLISLLDRWVMRAACKQLREWRNAGLPPVVVSVNMSAIEFNQVNLLAEVQQVLTDTGIDPQSLEIELTETTLMKHSEHVLSTLTTLQKLGIRLSIDDFGTGYSSLAYLKRYPLDKLKIDRAFVKDTPQDQDYVSLVTAIIQMARSLNLRTVAEGVETKEQWDLLKQLGCELIQGYYLSRPMTAEDALRWQQHHCQTPAPQ